ncbi:hypothetical protein GHT06_010849 [Daphnia sinensis]|uniref:Uncharacterized protein n=1 Tax=Daphnia sinensis TaxID=1820382 RepID=A0AAD5KWD2_9CRUS|nr:hypothetical protein GHT06_005030 [Daphnia sinensis]KAI9563386.1 hypothetical protein GHT06_010849 [Daphnia sinensis]
MNSYVPMSMPYSGAPMSYAAPPPSYAPPSYAPPSYAPSADYAAPIPLTPLVIPDDAGALGGGGGGGGGSITKFFALPLIVVLPILLPFLVILFFLPKFGKKPIKDKKEYEDMKPYYDDKEYDNNYMDDKPNKDNRKRRQVDTKNISSSSSGLPSMTTAQVDRLTDVVFAAINSQECIQRLLCEAGAFSRSFSDTAQAVTKAVKEFVPKSIKNAYDVFANVEKCEQYKCGSLEVRK